MLKKEFIEIYETIDSLMSEALKNSSHPYRTFSLASIDGKIPSLRTVVLRDFSLENNYFDCHSDLRSPKIKQLEKNKKFSALFYSSKEKIQLRFKGIVEIFHKNSITKQRWENVTPSSKRCYMGPYNPSDVLEEYHPNIPDNVQFKDPTDQDSASGYNNFVIIRCHFYEIDFLKLKYSGHQRYKFVFDKEKINVSWVAP
jgi:pyridoxamine 5'-phosphate oxidase